MKKLISAGLTLAMTLSLVTPANAAKFNKAEYEGKPVSTKEFIQMLQQPYADGETAIIDDILSLDLSNVVTGTNEFTVTIDETTARPVERMNLGIQCEYADTYGAFFDTNTGELLDDYVEFAKNGTTKLPVFRWGGTSSTYANFMDNVGPFSQRQGGQPMVDWLVENKGTTTVTQPAMEMGPAEYIKMMQANNPDAMLLPCPSLWAMETEEIINFAHYLYDEKDESVWGALRASDGIEDPVPVWYWEMTNEIDQYGTDNLDYIEWYCNKVRDVAEGIRAFEPEAKFVICGPTAPWGNRTNNYPSDSPEHWSFWHKQITERLGDVMDAITFHLYYDGIQNETIFHEWVDTMKADCDAIIAKNNVRDKDGNLKDIKVISTEASRFWDPNSWSRFMTISWEAMLSTAHYFNHCFERPWYIGSTHHSLGPSNLWGMWNVVDGEWVDNGYGKLNKMYDTYLGDRLVGYSFTTDKLDGEQYVVNDLTGGDSMNTQEPKFFSMIASAKGDDELRIIMLNKAPYHEAKVSFNFGNEYTLVEEAVYSAPNATTHARTKELADLMKITVTEKNEPNFNSYTIGPARIVALTFKTDGKIAGADLGGSTSGDLVVDSTGSFKDIQSHWARNEIAYFQQNNIVAGVGGNMFMPDETISNAELSAITVKALGLDTSYASSAFIDVYDSDWYAPFANVMKAEGFIRGRQFMPASNITLVDLCKTANKMYKKLNPDAVAETIEVEGIENLNSEDQAAVKQAVGYGLINRLYENGFTDFTKNATRAEAVSVLYRIYTGI